MCLCVLLGERVPFNHSVFHGCLLVMVQNYIGFQKELFVGVRET